MSRPRETTAEREARERAEFDEAVLDYEADLWWPPCERPRRGLCGLVVRLLRRVWPWP